VKLTPNIATNETIFNSTSKAENLFKECVVGNCPLSDEYYTH